MHFISVSMYLQESTNWSTVTVTTNFYMVNRATRRFTRQQGKHRTFISQFLQDSEYWSTVPGYEPATSRPAVKCTTN